MQRKREGLSRTIVVAVVVVIIVILALSSYVALVHSTSSTTVTSTQSTTSSTVSSTSQSSSQTPISTSSSSATSSQTSSTSSSTSTSSSSTSSTQITTSSNVSIPSTFTWETSNTLFYPDPPISTNTYDLGIEENVYEPLLWFNGSSSVEIPWLAQNYSTSSDGLTINFSLRSGIQFADGEPLNSSAVYFTLNRILIEDGSTPVSHGTGPDWIVQQLLNTSLSTALSGQRQPYTSAWVNEVLAQNFVQITGPLTFTIHLKNPNAAFPVLIGASWAFILAPNFVMQHDLSLWNQTSAGYKLPYAAFSGNETSESNQYFMDEAATCNSGITPNGCGTTFLEGKSSGTGTSLAGTGPYTVSQVDLSTNDIVLQSNPKYWGGPYQYQGGAKITPQIATIDYKYVPDLNTREIDIQNAAKTGQAMTIDVSNDNLYDFANRNAWLNQNELVSTVPGVSLYGPFIPYIVSFETFDTNVTNAITGNFYTFQPFADIRFREAFADSVNMTDINQNVNNKLGQVALNAIPPQLPPQGAYNSSLSPIYSFNLTAVQDLLLSAMEQPLTHFTFKNGTAAPQGVFNNTFGCQTLPNSGQCAKPVQQTITLNYYIGTTYADEQILTQIATAINNVSSAYNMGLQVDVAPVPLGAFITAGLSGYYYTWSAFMQDDYPWSLDFLGSLYAPGQGFTPSDGWNLTQMGSYYQSALKASSENNLTALVHYSDEMNILANQEVMYLWTLYPANFVVMTSNVQGYYYNPGLWGIYFATLT